MGIGHRGHRSSLSSRDEISTSLLESRLDSLNLHCVGSLGSLNCRSVSRGDGTVGMANNGRGTLVNRSTSIGPRSYRSSLSSRDEISTSLLESRLDSLNLHGVGSLGSLNCRSVSRSDGTVGMANNGRGTLANRSTSIGHRGQRSSLSSRDEISTSLLESRLDSLNLHGVGSLSSLNCRSVSRGEGTIGMVDSSRGGEVKSTTSVVE